MGILPNLFEAEFEMNILQLIPSLSGGGARRFIVDLSNQLAKEHKVTLLTLYDARENSFFRSQLVPEINTKTLGKQPGFDWRMIPKLWKVIKEIEPDIIHNHLNSFNYLIPLIPFLGELPIVHTVHSDAFKECRYPLIRSARKICFKRKNVVPVTISDASAISFEKVYSNTEQTLIYNGRAEFLKSENYDEVLNELSDFKRDDKTLLFTNIGRIVPEKNQLMLIAAFNRLIYKDNANAVLLIIGGRIRNLKSRQLEAQLTAVAEEHEHIYLLGEHSNATDYLFAADFFCLSSVYEGMPISLIEAFAAGAIPICTPVGGIPQMVNDLDSSLLAEKVDVDDYYRVLKRAYEMPNSKQQIVKQKIKLLFKKKYSLKHCALKYEDLYKDLTSNNEIKSNNLG